jgi:hypothetical protein
MHPIDVKGLDPITDSSQPLSRFVFYRFHQGFMVEDTMYLYPEDAIL